MPRPPKGRQGSEQPVARPRSPAPPAPPVPRVLLGTDIVVVSRLQRLLADHPGIDGEVFTPRELSYCEGRRRAGEHLAARFAAKESVLKALGTGLGPRTRWTDVEVVNDVHGRPRVRLHGAVAAVADRRRVRHVDVSLSHVAGLAVATAALVCTTHDPGTPPREERDR
jgi:holo-[acyl-carrier protein] synthase